MAGTPTGADLERLLAERGTQLMRVAIALAGSREAGEDLLQAALERVLRKPWRVDRDTEGYLRSRASIWCRPGPASSASWTAPPTG
jgi:DNA-directed RNA polymerase specialized sigma24 family protein